MTYQGLQSSDGVVREEVPLDQSSLRKVQPLLGGRIVIRHLNIE